MHVRMHVCTYDAVLPVESLSNKPSVPASSKQQHNAFSNASQVPTSLASPEVIAVSVDLGSRLPAFLASGTTGFVQIFGCKIPDFFQNIIISFSRLKVSLGNSMVLRDI